MNKKGFTLIELVTVIALLGIISIIAFVSIFQVINKSKVSDCENLLISIKSATKEYVSDNRYNVKKSGSYEYLDSNIIIKTVDKKYIEIDAEDLFDDNYLISDVKDEYGNVRIAHPFGENDIVPSSVKIRVYLNGDYSASSVEVYKNSYSSSNEIKCENEEW